MGEELCPILGQFRAHWSFMQVELHPRRAKQGRSLALAFATDVIFRRQADFQPLYQAIVRTAVQAIKADELATFLGRKLISAFTGEAP